MNYTTSNSKEKKRKKNQSFTYFIFLKTCIYPYSVELKEESKNCSISFVLFTTILHHTHNEYRHQDGIQTKESMLFAP